MTLGVRPGAETGGCDRCGTEAKRVIGEDRFVCGLCRRLRDKSFVWLLRRMKEATEAERKELVARFAAAESP